MSMKKQLAILAVLEVLLAIFIIVPELKKNGGEKVLSEKEISGIMVKAEDSSTFNLPEGYEPGNQGAAVLSLNYGKLKKGSYRGTVIYKTDGPGRQEITFDSSNNDYVRANRLILDPHLNTAVFDVIITNPVNNFKIIVENRQNEELSIDLRFEHSSVEVSRCLFTVIVLFTLLEFMVWAKYRSPRTFKAVLAVLGIALAAFLPYLLKGIMPGHDFTYHFLRIEGLVYEIRSGQFPVYMESLWIGDHGYPVSLYYSDLLLYIPAFFRLIGFSVQGAYKLFIFLLNVLTALIAFRSFRKIFRKESAAWLLAFVYTCSPYRLMDIYVRSSVGEFCAISFLPLIAAGFYSICGTEPADKGGFLHKLQPYLPAIFDLAFGMSGVFLSHMLTTEMSLILLVILTLVLFKKLLNPWRIAAILIAAVCTILMCLIFLIPFIDFSLNNEIEIGVSMERVIPTLQEQGVQPGELFMFTKDIFGSGANNGMEIRMYLSTGMVLMLTVITALVRLCLKKGTKRLALFTAMSCLCLFLASTLFPWDYIAYHNRIGVLLSQIQFPWRYLVFAALFSVLTLGELLMTAEPVLKPVSIKLTGQSETLFYGLLCLVGFLLFTEINHISGCYSSVRGRVEWFNTNEIVLSDVPPYHILRHGTDPDYYVYEVLGENISIESQLKSGTSWQIHCKTGEREGTVTMPLNNYKGFRAIDTMGNEFKIRDGENKAVSFTVPAQYEGDIGVAFHPASSWHIAAIISGFCWLIFLILSIRAKKRML